MAAGHERFKFQPTFQLTCKVLNDRLQTDSDVEYSIMRALDYQQVFREFGHPLPEGAIPFTGDLGESTQTKAAFTGVAAAGTGGRKGGRGGADQSPGSAGQCYGYESQIAADRKSVV